MLAVPEAHRGCSDWLEPVWTLLSYVAGDLKGGGWPIRHQNRPLMPDTRPTLTIVVT
jgi:hypothetical protein